MGPGFEKRIDLEQRRGNLMLWQKAGATHEIVKEWHCGSSSNEEL
jgi:hypothetical protein